MPNRNGVFASDASGKYHVRRAFPDVQERMGRCASVEEESEEESLGIVLNNKTIQKARTFFFFKFVASLQLQPDYTLFFIGTFTLTNTKTLRRYFPGLACTLSLQQ